MIRLKQDILKENQLSASSITDNSTPSTSFTGSLTTSTPSFTTRSSDAFVYGAGAVIVLAKGCCVFYAYNKKS